MSLEPYVAALAAVLAAVLLLLVIACVNVTNLLFARAATRRGEFAMRAALGASRSRIVRQLVAESVLLAACGGLAGILLAQAGVRGLLALSPPGLPRVDAIGVDGAVLAFTVVLTLAIGIVLGLASGLRLVNADMQAAIQRMSPRLAGPRDRTRRTLVVAEVALAVVLLVGAGLLPAHARTSLCDRPGLCVRARPDDAGPDLGRALPGSAETLRFFTAASRRFETSPAWPRQRSRASFRSAATSTSTACTSNRAPRQ